MQDWQRAPTGETGRSRLRGAPLLWPKSLNGFNHQHLEPRHWYELQGLAQQTTGLLQKLGRHALVVSGDIAPSRLMTPRPRPTGTGRRHENRSRRLVNQPSRTTGWTQAINLIPSEQA